MKKLFIALAFAGISLSSMAQDADPTLKYSVATNSFWSNWFIQVGADWNAWYSGQEHGQDLATSPFKKFRSNPGVSVAVGKWFTPGLGLRTKLSGIWGKNVTDDNNDGNGNKYWTLNEHVLFNLSNMLCGYNPNRVWNFIPFAGAGVTRSMSYNTYAMNYSLGILNTFRVSKKVGINFELGWDRLEGDADARLKKLLAEKKEEPTNSVKEFANSPVSVFFNINKYKIASRKDLVNVKEMAKYAKENDANILVTGYADSATGKPAYNQKLSEKRANTVADEIVKMGVSRDKITTEAKGGVNDLSPISYNRRATVQIKD